MKKWKEKRTVATWYLIAAIILTITAVYGVIKHSGMSALFVAISALMALAASISCFVESHKIKDNYYRDL